MGGKLLLLIIDGGKLKKSQSYKIIKSHQIFLEIFLLLSIGLFYEYTNQESILKFQNGFGKIWENAC